MESGTATAREKVYEAVERLGRPTVRELQTDLGYATPSVVWFHLEILRAEGRVTWEHGKARTIRVAND